MEISAMGGEAVFKTTGNVTVVPGAIIDLLGGTGGNLTDTGASGNGGRVFFQAADVVSDKIYVYGGRGGANNFNGTAYSGTIYGGRGGMAEFKADNVSMGANAYLKVAGGNGGENWSDTATGQGGQGAAADFQAENLTVGGGQMLFVSGEKGLNSQSFAVAPMGGTGGDVKVKVTNNLLVTGETALNIARLNGGVDVDISTLTVDSVKLSVNTKYTDAGTSPFSRILPADHTTADEVRINTLVLADGATFETVNGSAVQGTFGLKNLETRGINNVLKTQNSYVPSLTGKVTLNLPADLKAGDTVLKSITAPIDFSGMPADNLVLKVDSDFTVLKDYDKVTLIDGAKNADFVKADGTTLHGVSKNSILNYYTFALGMEGTALTGTLGGPVSNAKTGGRVYTSSARGASAIVAELGVTGFADLNFSPPDLISSAVLSMPASSSLPAPPPAPVLGAAPADASAAQPQPSYGDDGGTMTRIMFGVKGYTGRASGRVDHEGLATRLGLAVPFDRTTVGAYIEGGGGSYDTVNNVAVLGNMKGDGDVDFFGGGLMVRHDFLNNAYVEGSFRGGSLDNDFTLKGFGGGEYDASTSYYGASLGGGYRFILTGTQSTMMDLYGKLYWTRTDSFNFKTKGGDRISIDDIDLINTRLGGRISDYFKDGTIKAYVGAAWEQQWDGESGGRANGERIKSDDSAKGASIFAEAGLEILPQDAVYSFDVVLFAKGGKERMVGGQAVIKFTF